MLLSLSTLLAVFMNVGGNVNNSIYVEHQGAFQDVIVSDFIVFQTDAISTRTRCASLCLYDKSCVSFFYNHDEQVCQGHSVLFLNNVGRTSKPGTKYYYVYEDWCSSDGYVNHRGLELCYKFYNASNVLVNPADNHQAAVDYCQQRNERLFTQFTEAQIVQVTDQFKDLDNFVAYIDGTDEGTEGTWHYSNGDVMAVFKWGLDEPENDYPEDHFINIRKFTDGEVAMSDTRNHPLDFICQKPK